MIVFDPLKIVFHPNKNGVSPHSFHTFTSFQSIFVKITGAFHRSSCNPGPMKGHHVLTMYPAGREYLGSVGDSKRFPQAGQLTWMGKTPWFPYRKMIQMMAFPGFPHG